MGITILFILRIKLSKAKGAKAKTKNKGAVTNSPYLHLMLSF